MNTTQLENCYKVLELDYGASLAEINSAWRKLSRLHHPDKHNTDAARYHQALEKQKQLNNARDVLRKYFDKNNGPPPVPETSAKNRTKSDATSSSTTSNSKRYGYSEHWQYTWAKESEKFSQATSEETKGSGSDPYSWFRDSTSNTSPTGWFHPTSWEMTPIQRILKKVDTWINNPGIFADPAIPAIILFFATLIIPASTYSATVNSIFPNMVGHFPDWLTIGILVAGFATSGLLFRWYFVELGLIKLQDQVLYFESDQNLESLIASLKEILKENPHGSANWSFHQSRDVLLSYLRFDEEVFPELIRPRKIEIAFKARSHGKKTLLAASIRVTSPITSLTCSKILKQALKDLKADLIPID